LFFTKEKLDIEIVANFEKKKKQIKKAGMNVFGIAVVVVVVV
jgi:hypothetical protein